MSKQDPDFLALKRAVRALNGCTSIEMVEATLIYLRDRYIDHPAKETPEHLRKSAARRQEANDDN